MKAGILQDQAIVITGANRGIGLALCKEFIRLNANVIAVCRDSSNELKQLKLQIITGIDLSKKIDLDLLNKRLDLIKIDVLIHSAGVFFKDNISDFNVENILYEFRVNALAPISLSRLLLLKFNPNAKILILSSAAGSNSINSHGGQYGYRMSKAAVNAGGFALAIDLKDKNISVALIHPGKVATEMTNGHGHPPENVAKKIIHITHKLSMKTTGQFWNIDGFQLPW